MLFALSAIRRRIVLPMLFTVALSCSTQGQLADSDGDRLPDLDELRFHFTNPDSPDTDGDGSSDYDEILYGSDPLDTNQTASGTLLWNTNQLDFSFEAHPRRSYHLAYTPELGSNTPWQAMGQHTRLKERKTFRYTQPLSADDTSGFFKLEAQLDGHGDLLREVWNNRIYVDTVAELLEHKNFKKGPSYTERLQSIEAPPTNGQQYGQRISGYIRPLEDADYTFWVTGSADAEFRLSLDGTSTASLETMCTARHTAPGQWDAQATQQSAPIHLLHGRKYYFELLHVATGNNDHAAVRWAKGNDAPSAPDATVISSPLSELDPIAYDDFFAVHANETLTIHRPGVLKNDIDGEIARMKAAPLSDPLHGTLQMTTDGGFEYIPETDYLGPDRFRYRIVDDLLGHSEAMVFINVTNALPNAQPDRYTVVKNGRINIPASQSVLLNDSDEQNVPLIAQLWNPPAHGTLIFNEDGSFSYWPHTEFTGTDSFEYRAADRLESSEPCRVEIIVRNSRSNQPPVAQPLNIDFNRGYPHPITLRGTDGNNDTLIYLPDTTTQNGGTLEISGDQLFYTPPARFTGTDSFNYRVTDGIATSQAARVTLNVIPLPFPEMKPIPAGIFIQGDSAGIGSPNERPTRSVTLRAPFSMAAKEITNREMVSMMNYARDPNGDGDTKDSLIIMNNDVDLNIVVSRVPYGGAKILAVNDPACQIEWLGDFFGIKDFTGHPDGSIDSRIDHPAVGITWEGALFYCWVLNQLAGIEDSCIQIKNNLITIDYTKPGYRLPTEAEWEYAARGGYDGARYPWWTADPATHQLPDSTRCNMLDFNNPLRYHGAPMTTRTGSYAPNAFGLHDMAGNAAEWCTDHYVDNAYEGLVADGIADTDGTDDGVQIDGIGQPVIDPTGKPTITGGILRSIRGGSYAGTTHHLRCARRNFCSNHYEGRHGAIGFRPVFVANPAPAKTPADPNAPIRPIVNNPPVITKPATILEKGPYIVGQTYTLAFNASDPDGEKPTLSWHKSGGPGHAEFDDTGLARGKTRCRFTAPGTYFLRAAAQDRLETRSTRIEIEVQSATPENPEPHNIAPPLGLAHRVNVGWLPYYLNPRDEEHYIPFDGRVIRRIHNSNTLWAHGEQAMVTHYHLYRMLRHTHEHTGKSRIGDFAQSPEAINAYLEDFRRKITDLNESPTPAFMILDPDQYNMFRRALRDEYNDDARQYPMVLNTSKHPDVIRAGVEDNLCGLLQTLAYIRDAYAPNVGLGLVYKIHNGPAHSERYSGDIPDEEIHRKIHRDINIYRSMGIDFDILYCNWGNSKDGGVHFRDEQTFRNTVRLLGTLANGIGTMVYNWRMKIPSQEVATHPMDQWESNGAYYIMRNLDFMWDNGFSGFSLNFGLDKVGGFGDLEDALQQHYRSQQNLPQP